jgi:hypothetical protein
MQQSVATYHIIGSMLTALPWHPRPPHHRAWQMLLATSLIRILRPRILNQLAPYELRAKSGRPYRAALKVEGLVFRV